MRSAAQICLGLIAWLCLVSATAIASPPEGGGDGEWVEEGTPEPEPNPEWVEDPDPAWVEQGVAEPDPNPEWVEEPNPEAVPEGAVPAEAGGEDQYFEPGEELSDEQLAALTAMLEQELGDSEAVQALAASGYVLCNPQGPRTELIACIRSNLAIAKTQVRSKAVAELEQRDSNQLGTIVFVVFFAGFAGLLLLAMPLFLRKRYPNQGPTLFKFSVLATVLFGVNMFLFAVALFVLRIVQSVGAQEISPKLAMVDASFSVLESQAGELVDLFPVLFEPTIIQLAEGSDKDMTVLLLENIGKLEADLAVFQNFAAVFRAVNSLTEYSDVAFGLIAVVVFSIGFKDVFLDIIKLPIRAIEAPNDRAGRTIARSSLARSGREMLVVLVMFFVILTLTGIAGWTMRLAVGPAIEALLGFVVIGVFHVQLSPDASTFAIYVGLGCVAIILVLNIAVVMVSNVLFLSRAQRLVRARLQWKVPLRQNWKFFVFGLAIVVGVQLLPWLYLEIASSVFDMTMGKLLDSDDPPLGFVLLFGGVALLGFWVLAFWAARGLWGLGYLARYRMPASPSTEPATVGVPVRVAHGETPPAPHTYFEAVGSDSGSDLRPGLSPGSGPSPGSGGSDPASASGSNAGPGSGPRWFPDS